MKAKSYVEQLREIRDRINEEISRKGWEAWEREAHGAVLKTPELARMLNEANTPAAGPGDAKPSDAATGL